MIDEYNIDKTGWARFSDDFSMRYRLARSLTDRELSMREDAIHSHRRVVFVMLNPSTADAFKLDPTVSKCCQFAKRWGADVLEVVNLFALRSPHPTELDRAPDIGDGPENDAAIMAACTGAERVVAAWGNHGWRRGRADIVRSRLAQAGVTLLHLGTTKEGRPLHPLARGKSFIPLTRDPEVWT